MLTENKNKIPNKKLTITLKNLNLLVNRLKAIYICKKCKCVHNKSKWVERLYIDTE